MTPDERERIATLKARRDAAKRDEALEALRELADLIDDIRVGDYVPDSFTNQIARRILAQYEDNAVTGVTQEDSDER